MEKTTKDLINALSSGPARKYIDEHEHADLRDIILKHKEILGIPTARLFDQIASRKKAKDKLPLYYQNPAIIYPPPENFEQSSSEKTAIFKSEVIDSLVENKKSAGADLTGGFGVDTYFFSRKAGQLHYVETDLSLLEIAKHNHRLLGANNIEYHATPAEDFIRNTSRSFDFIFIDPSRRTEKGTKVHALDDSRPDILRMTSDIFQKTATLMVKASPLFDIQAGISQIPFVRQVYVVSVNNECKELLFVSARAFKDTPVVEAVDIQDQGFQKFSFTFAEEREHTIGFSEPLVYLYEPNASILKAGAFKTVAARFNLRKIQASTHLYTGSQFVANFPGRKFLVEALVRPDPAEMKKFFPEGKANVTTRNYPLSPEALKKKTGLKDGGEKFLIGFSGQTKKFLAVARRLSAL